MTVGDRSQHSVVPTIAAFVAPACASTFKVNVSAAEHHAAVSRGRLLRVSEDWLKVTSIARPAGIAG